MNYINDLLLDFGLESELAELLSGIANFVLVLLISAIAYWITKRVLLSFITRMAKRNQFKWDDALVERRVFHRLSHIVPAIVISAFAPWFPEIEHLLVIGTETYVILVGITVIDAFLNAVLDIYQTFEISKQRPIRGLIQVVKIVFFVVGSILIIANLIGESPIILLSGLGALSAVLMLVFQDSILGLVAGVQLSANDMVRVGDWISMPKYDADGDVIDITLNTVKVSNWDKTVTMIPAKALISDSFINWRGMTDSGGRRIKRSIYVDTTSIRFCTPEMIERFRKIHYLSDYITSREKEIEEYNERNNIDRSISVNGRALTNVGVFRTYIRNYIENHPGVNHNMTKMVRQLAPGEYGLPLEIYIFTNDTRWVQYEGIQSDIFDHIFAIAHEFGIRIYQNPTGHDLQRLAKSSGE